MLLIVIGGIFADVFVRSLSYEINKTLFSYTRLAIELLIALVICIAFLVLDDPYGDGVLPLTIKVIVLLSSAFGGIILMKKRLRGMG
jgi:hypothetical protein